MSATNVSPLGEMNGATFGIALSAGYGTVATKLNDGIYRVLGKIDAPTQYINMMRRRDLQFPVTRGNLADDFRDYPRQASRRTWKRLGFPVSTDVGHIASMIARLVDMGREGMGSTAVNGIVVAIPSIQGFDCQDFDDALEYLTIRGYRLKLSFYDGWPSAAETAYAAHGRGLCQHFRDRDACWEEVRAMPYRSVLLVELTKTALTLQYDKSLKVVRGHKSRSRNDFEFSSTTGDNEEKRFVRARQFIAAFVEETGYGRPPTVDVVVIAGELAADDEILARAVDQGLHDAGVAEGWTVLSDDPTFSSAKGAAELAWRQAIKHSHVENGDQVEELERIAFEPYSDDGWWRVRNILFMGLLL